MAFYAKLLVDGASFSMLRGTHLEHGLAIVKDAYASILASQDGVHLVLVCDGHDLRNSKQAIA
eukprot:1161833-Pelagomonas_calceolata.AAC.16